MDVESTPQLPPLPSLVIGGKVVDGRTVEARRYKAVAAGLVSDLGGEPSTAQWLLCCRAAGLTVLSEMLDADILTGKEVDVARFATLTNSLLRVLNALGLERRAKDITPGAIHDAHAAAVREMAR